MNPSSHRSRFWTEAFQIKDSAWPRIMGRVLFFTFWAAFMAYVHWNQKLPDLNIGVGPFEVVGAVLGILMVLRTNSGYDRWWEGRRLWGGIVNQSRNLFVIVTAYGKDDSEWRDRVIRKIAAFGHVARRSLRGEREMPEVAALLGVTDTAKISAANHMPTALMELIALDLRAGLEAFPFQQAEVHRGLLIDHIGGCERISKTPLPLAYSVEIRRFILLFLISLPFAMFEKIEKSQVLWLTPIVEFLAAYLFLALDRIGAELQEPFLAWRLNHLPLDEITAGIEQNLMSPTVSG